jgi:hypothetical protein
MIRYNLFEGHIRSVVEPNIIRRHLLKIFSNKIVITSTPFKQRNVTLRSDIHKTIKFTWDNLKSGKSILTVNKKEGEHY